MTIYGQLACAWDTGQLDHLAKHYAARNHELIRSVSFSIV